MENNPEVMSRDEVVEIAMQRQRAIQQYKSVPSSDPHPTSSPALNHPVSRYPTVANRPGSDVIVIGDSESEEFELFDCDALIIEDLTGDASSGDGDTASGGADWLVERDQLRSRLVDLGNLLNQEKSRTADLERRLEEATSCRGVGGVERGVGGEGSEEELLSRETAKHVSHFGFIKNSPLIRNQS